MPVLSNPQHEKFAQAVVAGSSYSKAYIDAGYVPDGSHAHRLAQNGQIRRRVRELLGRTAARVSMTAADVVEQAERIANADIADAAVWDADKIALVPSLMLPPELTAAISEVRQTKDGVTIKFHSKSTAIEQLAKYHKLYKDSSELNVTMSLKDLVMASYREGDPHAPRELRKDEEK